MGKKRDRSDFEHVGVRWAGQKILENADLLIHWLITYFWIELNLQGFSFIHLYGLQRMDKKEKIIQWAVIMTEENRQNRW